MIRHLASREGYIHVVVVIQNSSKASHEAQRLLGQLPFPKGTATALPRSVVWKFVHGSKHFRVPLTTLFRIGGDMKTLNGC
jgi:hypothetical protein